jgi:hypothetical protein
MMMLRTVWLVATVAVLMLLQQLQPVVAAGVVSSTMNGGASSVLSFPQQLEYWKTVSVSSNTADKAQAATTPPSSSSVCSAEQVLADTCLFRYDLVCDADTVICDAQTDCFDCDPCGIAYATCNSCVADAGCVWCESVDADTQRPFGICSSVEFADALPNFCLLASGGINDGTSGYGSVCSNDGTNSTDTCDIVTDSCLYQFDLVCDSVGDSPACATGTDCFDCDPCQAIVTDAIDASIVDPDAVCDLCTAAGCLYCIAPASSGGLLAVCTSPAFASIVPNICVNSNGTELLDTCDGTNITLSTCDYANDSCLYTQDGFCDAADGSSSFAFGICEPNSDCMDCDPCQRLRYDGCDVCVAAGCYWCGSDAVCLSSNPMSTSSFGNSSIGRKQLTCTNTDDFTQTCPTSNIETNLYEDPLYNAQSWVYDQISVRDVWKSGISTFCATLFIHVGFLFCLFSSVGTNNPSLVLLSFSLLLLLLLFIISRCWDWHSNQ